MILTQLRPLCKQHAAPSTEELGPGADQAEVRDPLSGHVLAEATLMGRWSR